MSDAATREVEELRAEVARLRARFRLKHAPWPTGPKLVDVLVFIGATAVGLAILRAKGAAFVGHFYGKDGSKPTAGGAFEYYSTWSSLAAVGHGYMWSGLLVVMWTLAVLSFHLRPPRPRLRRLARRPGFAVCFAAALSYTLIWLIQYVEIAATRASTRIPVWFGDFDMYVSYGPPLTAGFATGSVWAVQALGGRGRPARDWLDRSGCALGVYWIGMIPASLLTYFAS